MKTEPNNQVAGAGVLEIVELGRISYPEAYRVQVAWRDRLLAARAAPVGVDGFPAMKLFLLEHEPAVITLTRRKGVADHLLASKAELTKLGIEVVETDRGGDITYHGPGQLVAYAILDLKRLGLGVHEYMHALEQIVIETLQDFGIAGTRDADAVGVWVAHPGGGSAKICALGVRISRWVTLHGLALNVQPNLRHFQTIVPCGLTGRGVTSMQEILQLRGGGAGVVMPGFATVKEVLAARFSKFVESLINGAGPGAG